MFSMKGGVHMAVAESLENYLENIYMLSQENAIVKSVDLANAMGFSKPSVSRAVHILADEGYLTFEKHGHLQLTEKGREKAMSVYERHVFLTQYFTSLGVDPDVAEADACRVEHVLSKETFEKVVDHISYCVNSCPANSNPLQDFTESDLQEIQEQFEDA